MDDASKQSEAPAAEQQEQIPPEFREAFAKRAKQRRGADPAANPLPSPDSSDDDAKPDAAGDDPPAPDDAPGPGDKPQPDGEGDGGSPEDSPATGGTKAEPSDLEREVESLRRRDAEREKEMRDLRSDLGRARKARKEAKPDPPALDDEVVKKADKALEEVRDWDPDTAEALEAERKALKERPVETEPEESDEDRQARLSAQASIVADRHPQWRESAKSEEFQTWLRDQPGFVRDTWERSEDGNHVADILSSWEGQRSGERESREKESRRVEARKESATTLPSDKPRGANPVDTGEDDAESAYKRAFDARVRARRESSKKR